MKELQLLETREVFGKELNIYGTAEEPLFLAKDVANWIEHSNQRMMLKAIDEDEKVKYKYPVNNPYGGLQIEEQWFLTENGLYEVLMQSRKPIAKQFKKEVKKILKEIRQYGYYAQGETIQDQMTTIVNGVKEKIDSLDEKSRCDAYASQSAVELMRIIVPFLNDIQYSNNQNPNNEKAYLELYTIDKVVKELYWDYHKYISEKEVQDLLINNGFIRYNSLYNCIENLNPTHIISTTPFISFSKDLYQQIIKYFVNRKPKKQVLIYK